MKKIVPLVSTLPQADQEKWISSLNTSMTTCIVTSIADLSDENLSQVEVAIVANPDPSHLTKMPNLKWVQSLWSGVENLLKECTENNFIIVRMRDKQLAITMSEAVLAWTLYLHRLMPVYLDQQLKCVWKKNELPLPHEQTVGVLGLGSLGRTAATRLLANGFQVAGWSRTEKKISGIDCYSGDDGFYELLSKVNILVVLLPLTSETEGLFNNDTFERIRHGAALINFARGQIFDEKALLEAVDNGIISHAVLDVFRHEPLVPEHPFWSHRGITVLPHIAAPTNKSTASKIAAQAVDTFFLDGLIPEGVNRELGY